jgi:hypothetical protein
MKGKKAVALGGSLLEKLRMARARGCGGRPWLPTAVSSDARARRWRRVARGVAVGGLNQRGKKEPRLRGATWRGGWSRALARSCHMGKDSVGGLADGKARDWWRWCPVKHLPHKQGSGAAHVGHACGHEPIGEGRELGRAREKSVVL